MHAGAGSHLEACLDERGQTGVASVLGADQSSEPGTPRVGQTQRGADAVARMLCGGGRDSAEARGARGGCDLERVCDGYVRGVHDGCHWRGQLQPQG